MSEQLAHKGTRRVRGGCGFVFAMILGAALLAAAYAWLDKRDYAGKLDQSLNQQGALKPRWLIAEHPCRRPNAEEVAHDAAMARLAEAFRAKRSNVGLGYVIDYFGADWSIDEGLRHSPPLRRCPPAPDLYARLAPILEQADWLTYQRTDDELQLVEHVAASPYLARRLAELAFGDASHTNVLGYDDRPYFRMLLAYQGVHAKPWAPRAMREMDSGSKLGTSAAFLAVAIDPDRALPRVTAAMERLIADASRRQVVIDDISPPGNGFTVRDGDRLYELAFALSMAGSKAEPYSRPLITLLDRRFGTGSHFGLILIEPTELCAVARHIGGRAAVAADGKSFCRTGTPIPR